MPLVNSITQRLDYLRDTVARRYAERDRIKWFSLNKGDDSDLLPSIERNPLFQVAKDELAALLDQLQAELDTIKQDGKITLKEAMSFIGLVIQRSYVLLQKFTATPEDRKFVTMFIVSEFYFKLLAPLDLPWIPDFLEKRFVDPMLGNWLLAAVDGLYDIITESWDYRPGKTVYIDKNTGLPKGEAPQPTPQQNFYQEASASQAVEVGEGTHPDYMGAVEEANKDAALDAKEAAEEEKASSPEKRSSKKRSK